MTPLPFKYKKLCPRLRAMSDGTSYNIIVKPHVSDDGGVPVDGHAKNCVRLELNELCLCISSPKTCQINEFFAGLVRTWPISLVRVDILVYPEFWLLCFDGSYVQ
jgi:hypothetical protein